FLFSFSHRKLKISPCFVWLLWVSRAFALDYPTSPFNGFIFRFLIENSRFHPVLFGSCGYLAPLRSIILRRRSMVSSFVFSSKTQDFTLFCFIRRRRWLLFLWG